MSNSDRSRGSQYEHERPISNLSVIPNLNLPASLKLIISVVVVL